MSLSDSPSSSSSSSISPSATALRNFSSQWFLVSQGTGITAIILHQLDYQFRGLRIVADVFWVMTIALFLLILAIYCARIIVYPKQVRIAIKTNVTETACLSSIVITCTTIIIMTALTSVRDWSSKWGTVAFVLWWIIVALTFALTIGTPYVFLKIEPAGTDKVSSVIFLPVICAVTVAAAGGIICRYGALTNHEQVPVIIVSYLLIGVSLPLTIAYDALFLSRCFDGNFPDQQQVYQIFLLCGPLGQGSFALQILGVAVSRGPFAGYGRGVFLTESAAMPIAFASEFAGLVTWGYATFWWGFAVISIVCEFITKAKTKGEIRKTRFSLAAWSVVYPWGVYTNAAVELGSIMDSEAFKVWSTALLIMLLIIWLFNFICTLHGVYTGKLLGLSEGWGGKVREEKGGVRWDDENEGRQRTRGSRAEIKRTADDLNHAETGRMNGGLVERIPKIK